MKKKLIIIPLVAIVILLTCIVVLSGGKMDGTDRTILYYNEGPFNKYAIVIEDEVLNTTNLERALITKGWDYRTEYSNEEFLLMSCVFDEENLDDSVQKAFQDYCISTDYTPYELTQDQYERSTVTYEELLIDGYYGIMYNTMPIFEMVYFPDADSTKLSAEVIETILEFHDVKVYKKSLFGDYELQDEFTLGYNTHTVNQAARYKDDNQD